VLLKRKWRGCAFDPIRIEMKCACPLRGRNRFGDKEYAAEELIAELDASFSCAHLGVEGKLRHAEYIASWLSLLMEDDRAIFIGAPKASAPADYLRSFSEEVEEAA
jgi:antirestriction protein ArdC